MIPDGSRTAQTGGVVRPRCESMRAMKRVLEDTQKGRQRYVCGGGEREFDDLTETNFTGHH